MAKSKIIDKDPKILYGLELKWRDRDCNGELVFSPYRLQDSWTSDRGAVERQVRFHLSTQGPNTARMLEYKVAVYSTRYLKPRKTL